MINRSTCGMCFYTSKDHLWCDVDPVPIETFSDRGACRFFRCAGCGGDDMDGENHGDCMGSALGVLRVVE